MGRDLVEATGGIITSWQHLCGFLRRAIIIASQCIHCSRQSIFMNVMSKGMPREIAPHLTLSILQQQVMSLHGYHKGGSGSIAEKL